MAQLEYVPYSTERDLSLGCSGSGSLVCVVDVQVATVHRRRTWTATFPPTRHKNTRHKAPVQGVSRWSLSPGTTFLYLCTPS
eukprot:scaffold179822_cov31-Tisochrysis_lutea.AAC.1